MSEAPQQLAEKRAEGAGATKFASGGPGDWGWWLGAVAVFLVLTVTTQVGGVICLAAWWISRGWAHRKRVRAGFVAGCYVVTTLWILPAVARPFGRVPLPLFQSASLPLAPRSTWFWLANRHYVKPEVRDLLTGVSRRLQAQHPGSVVHYLEGGFPFWDGFVMLPHWSHRNGKAVDLTFCYDTGTRGAPYGVSPSPVGYGIYEGPRPGEPQPYRGHSSWLRWDFPWLQRIHRSQRLDEGRTRDLVNLLLQDERTSKVLLELHLQERLGLAHRKLRFQQLHAARHDDHLHVVVQ